MVTDARPVRPRRSPAPPPAVRDELVRAPLLAALDHRFDVAVTVVSAGAGFGKTTLVAQAMRAGLAAPRGVDVWVSCQPGDEDAGTLASAIAAALGSQGPPREAPSADLLVQLLVDAGPVDVCVVLDDVHELPPASSAARLLADLIAHRPPHVHFVLAGRTAPPVPLARMRAAGDLVDLDEGDLAFTEDEAVILARSTGRPTTRVEGLAGWPSLVRLALSAGGDAPDAFLWEEVLDRLPDDQRGALLALATLGDGDAASVAQVAGRAIDLDALADAVPLVRSDDTGRWFAHALWEEAAARAVPACELERLRRVAVDVLLARGDTVAAGWRARSWGDVDLLARAARVLVRTTLGALPIDTAAHWCSDLENGPADHPDLRLLRLAVRHARRGGGEAFDRELDDLAAEHVAAGDTDGAGVTLALGIVSAHFRGDLLRVIALAGRLRGLPGVEDDPVFRFLLGAVDAGAAALLGDPAGALAAIDRLPQRGIDRRSAELVARLEVSMLLLLGRADEAAAVAAAQLSSAASAFVRTIPPVVRWIAGDPSAIRNLDLDVEPDGDTEFRDRHYHAAYGASLFASLGDRPAVEQACRELASRPPDELDARDSAIVTGAVVTRSVLDHDERGAAEALRRHLDRHDLTAPVSDLHLRRVLALAYVLDADARTHWDAAPLGPTHERARGIARGVLAARADDAPMDPPASPDAVLTTLPLPWSVELAARAAGAGRTWGTELGATLADWAGAATRIELTRVIDRPGATRADRTLARGARALLDVLPDPLASPVRIDLIGPARVVVDGAESDAPNLRRGRVRTLLSLLTVLGPVRRDQVTELLWPDHDPADAARNLRVLLTRLRAVLEPGYAVTGPGRCGGVLRTEGETLSLCGPPRVDSDVWELARLAEAAERAHAAGDATDRARALDRAEELWRGEPLADLASLAELAPEVEHVRLSLLDAVLDLGELRLAAGDATSGARCAARARTAAPYDERALRLLVAAALQRRDPAAVAGALADVESALREVGADPEPPTAMLIRQAREVTGTAAGVVTALAG